MKEVIFCSAIGRVGPETMYIKLTTYPTVQNTEYKNSSTGTIHKKLPVFYLALVMDVAHIKIITSRTI
jgi:hypothetical protein